MPLQALQRLFLESVPSLWRCPVTVSECTMTHSRDLDGSTCTDLWWNEPDLLELVVYLLRLSRKLQNIVLLSEQEL